MSSIARHAGRGLGLSLATVLGFAACAPINRSLGDDLAAAESALGGAGAGGAIEQAGGAAALAGASNPSTGAIRGVFDGYGGKLTAGTAGAIAHVAGGKGEGQALGEGGAAAGAGSAAGAAGAVAAGGAAAGAAGAAAGAVGVAGADCFSPDRPEGALTGAPGCACPNVELACSIVDGPPLIGFKRVLHLACNGHWQPSDSDMCPGAKCLVNGKSFASGTTGVPDPFDCNTCTCWEGKLINCTAKSSCLGQCPSGQKLANQCSVCGPGTLQCSELQTGCFDRCAEDQDCADDRRCVSGLCRRSVCSGTGL